MSIDGSRDFLDVLRELNAENINDDPQKRDNFFKCLYCGIKYDETLLEEKFKFKREKYILPNHYFNNTMEQILVSLISNHYSRINDLGSYLYWESPGDILYACRIEAIRDFIELHHPEYFQEFKERILEFLIYAYCVGYRERKKGCFGIGKYYLLKDYDIRLNKIIVIYAEAKGYLKFASEKIPVIIEETFLRKISSGVRCSFDELLNDINDMLGRTIVNNNAR